MARRDVAALAALWMVGCGPSENGLGGGPGVAEPGEPLLSWTPDPVDFGAGTVGQALPGQLLLRNDGTEVLEVTGMVPDTDTVVLDGLAFPLSLVPGGEAPVGLTWTVSGELNSLLRISSNDDERPLAEVGLVGRLALPRLEVSPDTVDYSTIPPECVEQTTLLLRSIGELPVTVDSLLVSGDGFALAGDPLPLPLTLAPGEEQPFQVAFSPLLNGAHNGVVRAYSDDPGGERSAELFGLGDELATCDGLSSIDLEFEVRYERADVAFLVDNTVSMQPVTQAFEQEIAGIFADLSVVIPDLTIGFARHEDYSSVASPSGRPFRLFQQQTDDVGLAASVIGVPFGNISGGTDWEEASTEALYQAATGMGYDQNCNGAYDSNEDVRPFVAGVLDPFRGLAAGTFDPSVPGTGTRGGMGFREGVLPVFVSATDAMMKDPEEGHWSPRGCHRDATLYDAILAVQGLGGKFIGIEVDSGGSTSPLAQMEAIAVATGSYGDIDGDYLDEPLVTTWMLSAAPGSFRRVIVDAIQALAGAARFDTVRLVVAEDPLGLVVSVTPEAYENVVAGNDVAFHLELAGTQVFEPTPTSSEIVLQLVGDDTIVLAERVIYVEP